MKTPKKVATLNAEQGRLVIGFFVAAYEDYLAARQLLVNNLLVQGCMLANTSIEKYFKGMKAMLGEPIPRHHDITANRFRNTIKNKFSSIYDLLNFEFVEFISKSYNLRYYDEIKNGFNIAIVRGKTLAELDYLVSEIERSFAIISKEETGQRNRYRMDLEDKNPLLWNHNHVLHGIDKEKYVEVLDSVYEFRKVSSGNLLQIYYVTEGVKNDGKFLYEAIKPVDDDGSQKSFSLCFTPLEANETA